MPVAFALALALLSSSPAAAEAATHETTAMFIRRSAGLPVASAVGQIEITDVGHGPDDTMLSIVANRSARGWTVSYACAASPYCDKGVDHKVRDYTISAAASVEVDELMRTLGKGAEPDGQLPSPGFIGGWMLVSIDYQGSKRDYCRVGQWGSTLGRLETLLSAREP